jgi:hypothetical protein
MANRIAIAVSVYSGASAATALLARSSCATHPGWATIACVATGARRQLVRAGSSVANIAMST